MERDEPAEPRELGVELRTVAHDEPLDPALQEDARARLDEEGIPKRRLLNRRLALDAARHAEPDLRGAAREASLVEQFEDRLLARAQQAEHGGETLALDGEQPGHVVGRRIEQRSRVPLAPGEEPLNHCIELHERWMTQTLVDCARDGGSLDPALATDAHLEAVPRVTARCRQRAV